MKSSLIGPVVVLGLFTGAITTQAATILADYPFTGSSLASTDASANWDTTALGSGGGVPLAFDNSVGNPAPSLALSMGNINDGTFLDDDYYVLTITPDAGWSIDFTSFSFDINKISGGANVDARLYSSIGGFTAGQELGTFSASATNSWYSPSFDISSLPSVSTATEFRLYLLTTGTFGANQIKLDNLQIEGTPGQIPEPASMVMLGLGLLGLITRRRPG